MIKLKSLLIWWRTGRRSWFRLNRQKRDFKIRTSVLSAFVLSCVIGRWGKGSIFDILIFPIRGSRGGWKSRAVNEPGQSFCDIAPPNNQRDGYPPYVQFVTSNKSYKMASGKTRVSTRIWRARVMGKRRADLRDQFLMGNDARASFVLSRKKNCEDMTRARHW